MSTLIAARPPLRRPSLGTLARRCGPGVVVAVAYVDPGNFATNTQAGATTGTQLVWVVVSASAIAVLLQYLSAKLGVVTGRSLPEHCRRRYRPRVVRLLWAQAELVAMATDLAEVVGGAIALHLLCGLPMPVGGLLVAAAGTGLLLIDASSRTRFAAVIGVFIVAVVASFGYQALRVGVTAGDVMSGLRPSLGSGDGLLLATGIVGATVMPHALYLHSALARERVADLRAALRVHRRSIAVSLCVAGIANVAILLVAARALHGATTLGDAFAGLRAAGTSVALAFAVALLVSGLAASGVGTMAGDVVMQGFLRRRLPTVTRRLVTLVPAVAALLIPAAATPALLLSQVALSLGLPFALIPLVRLTASRRVMGAFRNNPALTAAAVTVTAALCFLNGLTLLEQF